MTVQLTLTHFPSLTSPQGQEGTGTWADACSVFTKHVFQDRKDEGPLFSFMRFGPGMARPKKREPYRVQAAYRQNDLATSTRVLVYDIDDQPIDRVNTALNQLAGLAHICFTTWKHPQAIAKGLVRCRLLLLLDRDVLASEYRALWQAGADVLLPGLVDGTCCDEARQMYYPSAPKGSEHLAVANANRDGTLLPVDQLLACYSPGTRTSSKSTVASRVSPPPPSADAETVAAASSSPGAVSFEVSDIQWKRVCRKLAQRNSPVAAAFERLLRGQSLAEPGERDGKITSMCWALARELPEADPDGIARFFEQSLSLMHSLSPFAAPCDVALKFRTAVHKQQHETAEVCLQCSSTGAPKANVENCLRVLRGDQNLYGRFVYDEFSDRVIVARPTPWDKPALRYPRAVTNEDFTMLEAYLSSAHHLDVKSTSVFAGVCAVARECSFHPVREYILGVVPSWDGVPRIDTWLIDYCGAQDCQTTRWASAWWLMSGVARIADPGCQSDYCLVLEGQQGRKKSTALQALASPEWFTDDLPDITNQVASAQALSGKLIVELSELASVRSAKDVDRTKAFLSRKVDRYRVPYGKVTQDFPRQCIFAGSTNDTEYLTDPTGGRRFWAVRVSDKDVDVEGLRAVRDQLWAEAAIRYAAGERYWPETEVEKDAFAAVIETRRVHDSWIDKLLTWCSNPIGYRGQPLTTAFLLETVFEIRASRRQDDQRLSSCLQSLGWGKTVAPGGFRYWVPPGEGLSVTNNNVFPLRSVS